MLGCVLAALSLCAPMLAIAAPAADAGRASEFRALAAPSSTALLSRAGVRHDHARQRASAPSLFTLVPLDRAASDRGCFRVAGEHRVPRSIWTAEARSGRSPPSIS